MKACMNTMHETCQTLRSDGAARDHMLAQACRAA